MSLFSVLLLAAALSSAVAQFFNMDLKKDAAMFENRWWKAVGCLARTPRRVNEVYWRQYYSFILCTIVSGLEDSYKTFSTRTRLNTWQLKDSFVLTGTKGSFLDRACLLRSSPWF